MALYAALTFWLLILMFTAWGVHSLWSRLIHPKTVNYLLLPGTLAAQLGHVAGLLLTGNPVQNLSLMGTDERGTPAAEGPKQLRPPIIGPLLVGLLPFIACGTALYFTVEHLGQGVLRNIRPEEMLWLSQSLPTDLAGLWRLPHHALTLAEQMLAALLASGPFHWKNALFIYLAVCLAVRMGPFVNNRRGAIFAILLAGVLIGLISQVIPALAEFVRSSWPVLSLAAALLLLLLVLSLVVTGLIGFARILVKEK